MAGRFAPEGGHSSDRDASPFTGGAGPSQHIGHFPIPAFPPYTVRTLHFHGGPATEDTTRTGACAALALILRGASSPQDPEAAPEQPRGPQMSPGHRAVRSRSCSKPAAKRPSKLILAAPAIAPYVRGAAQNPAWTPLFKRCWETSQKHFLPIELGAMGPPKRQEPPQGDPPQPFFSN